ncbi:MAG: hypothetical protein WCP97_01670 [bacterium]
MSQTLIPTLVFIYCSLVVVLYLRIQRFFFTVFLLVSIFSLIIGVVLLRTFGMYELMQTIESTHTAFWASILGIPSSIWQNHLLIIETVTKEKIILDIGLECSSIFEMTIFSIIVGFCPLWKIEIKVAYIALGLLYIYIINILRILIIVGAVAHFGGEVLFIMHTVVARLFFFCMVMALYYAMLTRDTILFTRKKVRAH